VTGPRPACTCWDKCSTCTDEIITERDRARTELLPQVEKEKSAWVQKD